MLTILPPAHTVLVVHGDELLCQVSFVESVVHLYRTHHRLEQLAVQVQLDCRVRLLQEERSKLLREK